MKTMTESELKAGVIFGDNHTAEYVYMPASEVGIEQPICVYEHDGDRDDIKLRQAMDIIRLRSLKAVSHPRLGRNSF